MMIKNGKNLSIKDAKEIILAFEDHERQVNPAMDIHKLAIGQKIDLNLLKAFMEAINTHPHADQIDAVRIYLGQSDRGGQFSELVYDVVLVPVLSDGKDLHKVYDKALVSAELDTIVGNALPCPNVCPGNSFLC